MVHHAREGKHRRFSTSIAASRREASVGYPHIFAVCWQHIPLHFALTCNLHVRPGKFGRTMSNSATKIQCFTDVFSGLFPDRWSRFSQRLSVIIHPTQRAENGCKCISLKRQSLTQAGGWNCGTEYGQCCCTDRHSKRLAMRLLCRQNKIMYLQCRLSIAILYKLFPLKLYHSH